jgi:putative membrane protein
MHWGDMGAWGWVGVLLWMVFLLLLFGGLAAVLIVALRRPGEPRSGGVDTGSGGAERVLAERFARGEIDEEEYVRRRGVLRT